jgi:hypothetical protein
MISYKEPDDDMDNDAIGLGVSFIEDSISDKLGILNYIPIEIDGTKLYQTDKEYTFNRFEIDDKYLYIIFDGLYADDSNFMGDFIDLALSEGYDKDLVYDSIQTNFLTNLNLYSFYIDYKKKYKPSKVHKEFIVKCKILNTNNNILNKSEEIINHMIESNKVFETELEHEVFEKIFTAEKPMLMDINLGHTNYKLRLMKSIFKTSTAKSEAGIKIYDDCDNNLIYYLVTYIHNKGFITCNIYKTVCF